MKVDSYTFIVTGGASGLGGATSTILAQKGANVAILDRDENVSKQLAEKLGQKYWVVDVTNSDLITSVIDKVQAWAEKTKKPIGGVVTCAGVGFAGRTVSPSGEPFDLDSYKLVIDINLIGTFDVARRVASKMIHNAPNEEGERGVIIMVASAAAFEGQVGQAAYSASKGGIVGMTLPMARDLSRFGIRVMTLAPSLFSTAMVPPEKTKRKLEAMLEFPKRFGKSEEFAAIIPPIVENAMLSGSVIRLDGATRLGKL